MCVSTHLVVNEVRVACVAQLRRSTRRVPNDENLE